MTSTLRLARSLHVQGLRPSTALAQGLRVTRSISRAGVGRNISMTMPCLAAHDDFLRHNQKYVAEKHEHADLAVQPAKKLAVGAWATQEKYSRLTGAVSRVHGRENQHACALRP
jgi:hypothetical protein